MSDQQSQDNAQDNDGPPAVEAGTQEESKQSEAPELPQQEAQEEHKSAHSADSQDGEQQQEEEDDEEDENLYTGELTLEPGQLGCKHYLRACMLQCPDPICEGAFYACRFCHDEVMYDNMMDLKKNHRIDRHAITHIKCLRCDKVQPKSSTCTSCQEPFSKYYCEVCTLYDDKSEEKGIYHCEKCGICKVGGRETSYHCDGCNCCYKLPVDNGHICQKDLLKQNCGICLEDLSVSRQSIIFLKCKHNMHRGCLDDYLKNSLNCPVCRKSLIDPLVVEDHFDREFARYIMPEEYRNAYVNIFCHDCEQKSLAPFHVMGAKCAECRSYNTVRDKGDLVYLSEAPSSPNDSSAAAQSNHTENGADEESKQE